MFDRIIRFLIYNKLVAVIIFLIVITWGLATAPFDIPINFIPRNPVPVDAIPDIGENQQIVFTSWPGRSPKDIEDQISFPLTTALLGIPKVKTVRSSSMFGFSTIYIIFNEKADFYWSRSRILEKLNSLPSGYLPSGAQPELGPDATGLGQIFWYTLEGRDKQGNSAGGWDLHELRSIQDYYVKYALASAGGVSEVASIGGFVKEYQINVDPHKLKEYGISLEQIATAAHKTNRDTGAKTIEINRVEYFIRGLGYVQSLEDLENTVITSYNNTPVLIKDLAHVQEGPAERRGILDKNGTEAVGGVVVARYGANPMEVINNIKKKIDEVSNGLPTKVLSDGRISKVTIVPFYDRTELIQKTLFTLNEALLLEILITILVILIMVFHLRASLLISGLLPIAVLMVFISMRYWGVEANIVALSGIAIAIGTMVDVGVILTENIIRHMENHTDELSVNEIVLQATTEVSGAILTAVATTIISFLPVFTLTGAEGKLFRPLAFTKTMALVAALFVALFLIPPLAASFFKKKSNTKSFSYILDSLIIIAGSYALIKGHNLGVFAIIWGIIHLIHSFKQKTISTKFIEYFRIYWSATLVLILLAKYWEPLAGKAYILNLLFIGIISLGILGVFHLFIKYYERLLRMALAHKFLFLLLPVIIFIAGIIAMRSLGKEFMPALNEGSFLLMPTSMPHTGISENKRILQHLDKSVASIPEIRSVVGKAGRVESALDPAPLSMFENIIQYSPEFLTDDKGRRLEFKVNEDGLFETVSGSFALDGHFKPELAHSLQKKYNQELLELSGNKNLPNILIEENGGKNFRIWRYHIRKPDDIWDEIINHTRIPGLTSAPKLQPIQTRLVMLQTGMRSPMGVKIKGLQQDSIEKFGYDVEKILKTVKGIKKEAVFADRIIGKPYLIIRIDRDKIARYGLHINDVQDILSTAIGGKVTGYTVEGRERYAIRIRYPLEMRNNPKDLKNILLRIPGGSQIPMDEVVHIEYEQGPQVIKSEDGFLTGYVLFDKEKNLAETDVVQNAEKAVKEALKSGKIRIPRGVNYSFTGTYENQIRATKTLSIVIPLALAIIFLILYFQFRSIPTSLMIFSGIAIAFSGGFILLWLYGQTGFLDFQLGTVNLRDIFQIKTINLSVAVWVGFIALFGIATDDGVVMASYLTQIFDKKEPGSIEEIRESVIEAGNKRIRPCLMTTATTLLALLPVLSSRGHGSDIMIPMAIPAFGGMLVALISLFVVPVLFSLYQEYKQTSSHNNSEITP